MSNKVTKELIESKIESVEYHRMTETLTVCVITLKNGFYVTGESACVDPALYDRSLGEKFSFESAFDKLWQLEGYLLKEHLYNIRGNKNG